MKKIATFILGLLALCPAIKATAAEGWPANYGGVMLQGFYWDSYSDTQWTNLESQADTLAKYFDLIWVPQSGYCNTLTNQMGYADIWWFDQKSCFGTANELKSMIQTFRQKGLLTIADVVINHKSGNTNWCDFPTETWNGQTMTWSLADICRTDEAAKNGYNVTGAADTGSDFDGSRDLDHTSANVQKNIKLYLQFLMEEMGYAGFRYDMTGGYAPQYTRIYNESANPTYSVGEYWMSDGLAGLQQWIDGTGKTSAAFDFQLKWLINGVFNMGGAQWRNLTGYTAASLIGSGYNRYGVTFVDNHDTGRESNNMLKANVEAANAYILTMPGTPCVWLTHWKSYKKAIKKMVLARKLAGITNQSEILTNQGENAGYSVSVKGSNGNLLLLLGTSTASTDGYKLAVEGTNYRLYISSHIDISSIENVGDEVSTFQLPDCATYLEGKTFAYFEKPANWNSNIYVWAWNGGTNFYSTWPGTQATKVGTASNGNEVWRWVYEGSLTMQPAGIIFSVNGNPQTPDFTFKNGGYYTNDGLQATVTASTSGINDASTRQVEDGKWYDLLGRCTSPRTKGIYIKNGKKYVK